MYVPPVPEFQLERIEVHAGDQYAFTCAASVLMVWSTRRHARTHTHHIRMHL